MQQPVIIHTNLYTNKAILVLKYFIDQYMRTDYRGVDSYTWVIGDSYSSCIDIYQEANGEVVLKIECRDIYYFNKSSWRTRINKPLLARMFFINQFGKKVKNLLNYAVEKLEPNKSNSSTEYWKKYWNCACDIQIDATCKRWVRSSISYSYHNLNVTFGDLKAIYEVMLGRKRMLNYITDTQRSELIGKKRNLVETELELSRRSQLKQIKDEYEATNASINSQYNDELRKFKDELNKKYNKFRDEAHNEYKLKYDELLSMKF